MAPQENLLAQKPTARTKAHLNPTQSIHLVSSPQKKKKSISFPFPLLLPSRSRPPPCLPLLLLDAGPGRAARRCPIYLEVSQGSTATVAPVARWRRRRTLAATGRRRGSLASTARPEHLSCDCLLFDLDETLYPVASGIMKNIQGRSKWAPSTARTQRAPTATASSSTLMICVIGLDVMTNIKVTYINQTVPVLLNICTSASHFPGRDVRVPGLCVYGADKFMLLLTNWLSGGSELQITWWRSSASTRASACILIYKQYRTTMAGLLVRMIFVCL